MELKDAITWIRTTCTGDVLLRADFRVTGQTLLSAVAVASSPEDLEPLAKELVTRRIMNMLYGEILDELKDIHRTLDEEDRELSARPWTWPAHSRTREKISSLRERIIHILS
jgi:hypothetical protein